MEATKRELNEACKELFNNICQKILYSHATTFAKQQNDAFEFETSTLQIFPLCE